MYSNLVWNNWYGCVHAEDKITKWKWNGEMCVLAVTHHCWYAWCSPAKRPATSSALSQSSCWSSNGEHKGATRSAESWRQISETGNFLVLPLDLKSKHNTQHIRLDGQTGSDGSVVHWSQSCVSTVKLPPLGPCSVLSGLLFKPLWIKQSAK